MVVNTKLTVEGVEYSDYERVEIKSSIGDNNSASSFKVLLKNYAGIHASDFNVGNEVVILAEKDTEPPTVKIITGIVEDIRFKSKNLNETIELEGRDYTARLQDSTVEPEVYNNTEISTIVIDIIGKYVSDITTNNVNITPTTLTHIAFNQVPVFDALKQLADLSGFIFWVDTDKDLHFELKDNTSSGETLDTSNVIKISVRESDKELYNQVWVYGDRYLTGIHEELQQIGTGSIFGLKYQPHNTQVSMGGSVPLQGGVFDMLIGTPISGTDYLVDFDQQRLVFVSGTLAGDNIPTMNGSVIVDYDRSTPIIKFGEDKPSISTYGPKTKIIQDKTIINPNLATDVLVSTINRFKDPAIETSLGLEGIVYLIAGQTVIVNLPHQNISNQTYTILETNYLFDKESVQSNQVLRVKLNKHIANITDTVKQLILDVRNLQAREIETTDVITRLEFAGGSVGVRVNTWKVLTNAITGSTSHLYTTNFIPGTNPFNLASGTNQGFLAGTGTGSPFGPLTVITSGGEA